MKVEYKNNLFWVEDQPYVIEYKDGVPFMAKVAKSKILKKEKLIEEMVEKLKDSVDQEIVMKEALWNIKFDHLKKISKTLNSKKKKVKPYTREGACADMKVGKHIIPIVR